VHDNDDDSDNDDNNNNNNNIPGSTTQGTAEIAILITAHVLRKILSKTVKCSN